jgi:hypothetical protein
MRRCCFVFCVVIQRKNKKKDTTLCVSKDNQKEFSPSNFIRLTHAGCPFSAIIFLARKKWSWRGASGVLASALSECEAKYSTYIVSK